MTKKENNSRKINAFSPNSFLKKHIAKRTVAVKLKNYLLIVFFIQALMLLVVVFFVGLVLEERQNLQKERNTSFLYWYKITSNYPERPDVLFNMAKSAYENGKEGVAVEYLNSALKIDPLFEEAIKFKSQIDKN